ncbi:metallophosphoesterase [Arenibacter sp. BSSL-BM3]|uniref:Metallophosphoesterase n=1 Tax=Arenibacter arenosicollis TaxID=2762274 RepID=A0ABR7QH65_9FLAO|nr:metallophosphoesterase [Arenibacter arenosicollis]MBC8766538.1 metallophosphoesterase [Arenibacter arenosicollis]
MNKHFTLFALLLLFWNCATYDTKYADKNTGQDTPNTKEISHTFYLIGDAGLSPIKGMNPALKIFKAKLEKATENSTAIFLGDNIYPSGLPDPQDSTIAYRTARSHLDAQLNTVKNYKGRVVFIPGNHDWYTQGLVGLKRQEKYVERTLDRKDSFIPEDGCPLETIDINDEVMVIAMDTEWYLTNWDKRPSINEDCEIKSREHFFEELESQIKKNAGKTIILAMHHPLFSYGPHGGQFTLHQQFYPKDKFGPAPVLGTLVNLFRKTAGASSEDMQNIRYRELINRVTTLAQFAEKTIVTSGHEHSLQYIVEKNIPQIVSGSGAKTGATNLLNGSKFSTGEMGYAVLEIYKDGSSHVRYYGIGDDGKEKFLFKSGIYVRDTTVNENKYSDDFPKAIKASVYTEEEVKKSPLFKLIWGERYRKYYGTKVLATTVNLDTLHGGLSPVRKGGGHQSKSLRLEDANGKQYVMRALRKEAERYLQAMAFKDQYIIGEFEDTYTESLLEDFYTGAHPYASLTIGALSDAAKIYHTNPRLFYIPKQPALEDFNSDFGDELYLLEEHVSDEHSDLESFGFPEKIESTYDFLNKLRSDEKYKVDVDMYIRARLFDMVIGDWDRHVDQWRWAENKVKKTGDVIFQPIPRDRDQVFSIMGDGLLMNIATRIIPPLKLMEGYAENIRNVKTFNASPFSLDMTLLNSSVKMQWEEQVAFLQDNLTEKVIDESFVLFPEEVQDKTLDKIKKILLSRLEKLPKIADEYYKALNKFVVIKGTDKDDWFQITVLPDNRTQISAYRIIGGEKKKLFYDKVFDSKTTNEIWIYGLDDGDYFEAKGASKNMINIRLVGGNGTDTYDIVDSRNISIYDYKTKDNKFKNTSGSKVRLTDDYELNTYQPLKLIKTQNQLVPTIGYNPDDGFKIGVANTLTNYGFRQNPFTSQHQISASIFFATSGIDLNYSGEFAHLFENWNFGIDARFTSPNFSTNFFGLGNSTQNLDDDLGMDYNRVRIRNISFSPSLIWRGQLGASLKAGISYEHITVEETENRFVNLFYVQNNEDSINSFLGVDAKYHYSNTDSNAFPTLGMSSSLQIGAKRNLASDGNSFGYVVPSLSLTHKIIPSGKLVLATKWKAHFNIGNGFEFYQGASIGANDGPRGYRNQRFIGKTSYYQNTDLRLQLKKMRTGILPISLGMYGGYDYGRVWSSSLESDKWHTSYGGGFFLNGADILTARIALFASNEGPLFSFGLGFGF